MSIRLFLLATTGIMAGPSLAASPSIRAASAPAAARPVEVAEIIVIGTRQRPSSRLSSATKTDTDLIDVPQAISVVTEQQIHDQAMHSIGDVLRTVPGASVNGGEGHRDHIVLRGNTTTADFFVDGLRDDVQYYRGLYNVDRVEVLKGPNAMIFGRGGGGGVVNRVTKRALPEAFANLSASVDQRGAWDLTADLDAPLASGLDGRVNLTREEFDSFRPGNRGHRVAVNPTLAWHIDADTRLDIGVEYDRDRRQIDRGIPAAFAGTLANPAPPLAGYDRTYFGQPGTNRSSFTGKVATAIFEHRFSSAFKVVARGLAGDYDKFYRNAQPATPVSAARTVGIEAYEATTRRKNLLGQVDLIGEVATGPVRHVIVAGVDYAHQRSHADRFQGFFNAAGTISRATVPLADTITIPTLYFRDGAVAHFGHTDAVARGNVLGLYVQDQANIADLVTLIAGLRRDRFSLDVDDLVAGRSFSRTDNLWSPRLGVVLTPSKTLSFYGSFSRSFLPQSGDQFGSLTVTTAALEPERFTNHEAGIKWRPLPGFDLTAAVYRLDRTNTRATVPVSGLTVLSGAQRSKGVELSATGQLAANLSLSASAAWQSARITSTTTAAPAGRRVALVPRFQASVWGRYDLSDRIGFGLGAIHQASSFASISNTVRLPAWTRVDAALFTHLTRVIDLQLNVENLLGERYYATASNDNNILRSNPRNIRATLRFGF